MSEIKSTKQNDNNTSHVAKDALIASKNLSYLNKPPSIPPNYGRQHYSVCYILKSKISRVLLYDNITQQRMLDRKLNILGGEQRRVLQLLDYHRKSFEHQRTLKQKRLALQARLPVTHFEAPMRVQPQGMAGGRQQQRLPEILSGGSSAQAAISDCSSGLNPLVSPPNHVRCLAPVPDREARTCWQTQYDQMSKLDDCMTFYANNNNNNNLVDSGSGFNPCKSQAKGRNKNFLNQDYDIRFVSLERLLTPMDKN